MNINDIKPEIYDLAEAAEKRVKSAFEHIDYVSRENTMKVMRAFQNNRVSEACFAGTTGYGYDDLGRDTLDRIYAEIFGTESALVRVGFVNGTHAITAALFSLCRPGEKILSVSGAPYDTLRRAIGIDGDDFGSLRFYGIEYGQVELRPDGYPDIPAITDALDDGNIKAVILQRSCGYGTRRALNIEDIKLICEAVKSKRPDAVIFADNCYGEFTETLEPTNVGVDLIAGSLIKNPGGGIAPAGGYVCGREELVERAAFRLTSPGIGGEVGATLGSNRLLYQGLFMAPHIVAQALKTSVFAASLMELMGMETSPSSDTLRSDIIQRISLGNGENMKRFCSGIQAGAPVDSYVTPEPWAMPGYGCDVIMADGSFIQGSSIDLSADGPFVEPFTVYLQGGLTYESGRLGVMMAASAMLETGDNT